ncbi:hypothetical protein [Litoribacillus peritrichatus]|uniref:Uncharacterized protein n=1 Tax=Litoribacillus peritrichatus TaxID=718191 RepID=A0ABP7MGW7_9GAMM
MKLTILNCETKKKGSYLLSLKYGDHELVVESNVCEGVVPYMEYRDVLQEILHKDVGEAKNMNRLMFKIYREESVDFPAEVGEF